MNTASHIFALLLASNATATYAAPPAPDTRDQAIALIASSYEHNIGYQIIESLTTEVGARQAGSEAEARARRWGATKFRQLGFSNVRIEPFEVEFWERASERAEIVAPFPQNLAITSLGGSVGTSDNGVSGDVVRFATLQALKDAPRTGLEGKIVFVDEPMTRTQDGSGYRVAVAKRSGAANEAGKRGALAALIRSVGTDHHRFPHTGQMYYQSGVAKVPTAALSAPDADQLQRALSRGPVELSLRLCVQSMGMRPSGNVLAEIPGTSDEIVLIGAHLDSWDLGTGAIDDGAGIGITVAAAKLILDLKTPPKRTIRVVMFGSEEVGLVGAKAYANKYQDSLDRHIVGTESDFGAGKIWRFDTRVADSALDDMRAIHKILQPLGISMGGNQASGGPDMGPLRELGMPVVTLMQNGWDYFDLHHTADDTLDKINPANITQNVAAYAAFVWLVANMDSDFRTAKHRSNSKVED
jgi:hypothetical protein